MTGFSERVLMIISSISRGKVASYGQIASEAGNPSGARQVSRLLHSASDKYGLPWHRVVNSSGGISLKGEGAIIQKELLEKEGIVFSKTNRIDMKKFGYF